jgi:sulfite reductase (ferredoxin)
MADEKKLSPVETFKTESNYLRGDIGTELVDHNDFFGKASIQLLKNHGVYQQDDRDARSAGRVEGHVGKVLKAYSFMVRTKIPGGKLTCDQMLAELDLCDEIGNATLRITSRQGLQLHGILKGDLWQAIHRINQVQLSTLAACGDVERNVMCCPAPLKNDPVRQQLQDLADHIARHLCPRTTAYHELWVRDPDSGEETLMGGGSNGHEIEPIYGSTYLPRKFKTAVGLPEDNCVDMYANDLAFMAIHDGRTIRGFNVLVGGGFGVTPSAEKTWPAVAQKLCYIRPEEAIDVATAIVKVQRDFGNRADRKIARLKYTIHNMGLAAFKAKVEEYYGQPLAEPDPTDVTGFDDHLGWSEQGDGNWWYGLNVENGRIKDEDELQLKTAVRKICTTLRTSIRLTPHQSILFCDVAPERKHELEQILRDHGVKLSHEISAVRRWSMACVAWPTCGLAITESERALPGMIDQLEVELAKLGLSNETFTVRMTGCPNGCSRPYNCDIGIVGRAMNKYTLYVGGRLLGDRLNFVYKDMVPHEEVVATIAPVLAYFKHERLDGETVGDFCHRVGQEQLLAWTEQFAATV